MSREIERKFMVKGDFKSKAFSHSHIEQAYIATAPGVTVRVRIRDDKGFLTIKGPSVNGGLDRYEFETEIPLNDAREIMKLCRPEHVNKDRWLVKAGNHVVEIDEFFDENEGLVMAEIELNSEDEEYEKPDFLGEEVTGLKRYYNKQLLRRPFRDWTEDERENTDIADK